MNPVVPGLDAGLTQKDALFFSPHKMIGGVQTPGKMIGGVQTPGKMVMGPGMIGGVQTPGKMVMGQDIER